MFISTFVAVLLSAVPAWAEEIAPVVGEDATQNVVKTKTQTPWFYWPGWAFLALTVLVLIVMAFSWYKTIYVPKYKGTPVTK